MIDRLEELMPRNATISLLLLTWAISTVGVNAYETQIGGVAEYTDPQNVRQPAGGARLWLYLPADNPGAGQDPQPRSLDDTTAEPAGDEHGTFALGFKNNLSQVEIIHFPWSRAGQQVGGSGYLSTIRTTQTSAAKQHSRVQLRLNLTATSGQLNTPAEGAKAVVEATAVHRFGIACGDWSRKDTLALLGIEYRIIRSMIPRDNERAFGMEILNLLNKLNDERRADDGIDKEPTLSRSVENLEAFQFTVDEWNILQQVLREEFPTELRTQQLRLWEERSTKERRRRVR